MVKKLTPASCLIMVVMILGGLQQALAEVRVSIDRNPVQVNESFQLVFSVDDSPDRDPDFSALQQDFLILSNNRSSSISIINGQYQRSVKWGLKLMAKQVGEFTIPAIRFGTDSSKPVQITVKPSAMASVPQDQLVLELLADQTEVFVQGQVILTLRLLSATDITAYQFGDIKLEALDAVVEPMGDVRQYQTRIADRSYLVLEKQVALFPQESGRLTIAPVLAEVRLLSNLSFDPFRTGGEIRQLRSRQLSVDVAPVPAEFSGTYWLPANRVELREEWQGDLTGLVAGEPVTRSVTLVADGLTAAQLPEIELSPIDGIKQYPDKAELKSTQSADGISGMRVQKVALIPGAEGRYRIPEIALPWWNLKSGKMEIVTIPSREIFVNAAASGEAVEAVVIEPASAAQAPHSAPVNTFWVWVSLLLALGWTLNALYWWHRNRHSNSVSISTESDAAGLRQARRQLKQACLDGDAMAARLALLAWGQACLNPRKILNLHQLGQAAGHELRQEIEVLNQSLYALSSSPWSGDSLWSLCQRLEPEIRTTSERAGGQLLPLNPAP